jgi:hypothetical protein
MPGERKDLTQPQVWMNETAVFLATSASRRERLIHTGYRAFFNQVGALPHANQEPQKHWEDYEPEEISTVVIPGRDERLLPVRGSLPAYRNYRIGIFGVRTSNESADLRREARITNSANLRLGIGPRRNVDLQLYYKAYVRGEEVIHSERSMGGEMPKWFDLKNGSLKTPEAETYDELSWLQLVNVLAEIYGNELAVLHQKPQSA